MSGGSFISVVIPTRDRLHALHQTLAALRKQTLHSSRYEMIVVDDGSSVAVSLPLVGIGPKCTVLRLEGRERSAARNAGARAAAGDLLTFIDDDIIVSPGFLEAHLRAHTEWNDALVVGAIRLPADALDSPFGRFRQGLERHGIPKRTGVVPRRNFCTAANMSIRRQRFLELGGFDEELVSAEDQDLAIRYTGSEGTLVFLAEAEAIHYDVAMNARGYCQRVERGSEAIVAFCRKHPNWPDNMVRHQVNGPVRWGREPLMSTIRKVGKRLVASGPIMRALFAIIRMLERSAGESRVLQRSYRLLLGAHILRGYRRGLARHHEHEPRGVPKLAPDSSRS
jgi:GT2 family glycosyltransferase